MPAINNMSEKPQTWKSNRWTDEEHRVLVQMTNDQIGLQGKNPQREILRITHFNRVSQVRSEYFFPRLSDFSGSKRKEYCTNPVFGPKRCLTA
jgi:hypothetical protein